jgi:transketolase
VESLHHPSDRGLPALSALHDAANTVRGLSMDAVQKANSGHPGAPMGMADMAVTLWTANLDYDPSDASWPDRDRFVLSNGHASMLLYSMLHLTGTSLGLEDLQDFRQWGAKTAGHPEFGYAPGIETTTGPLGQGFANGVGMALAEARLAAVFGAEIVDHYTYVFAGDGCLMEGVAYEAASFAGHLKLGKLIVLFDDNSITIDGSTDISTSEDISGRFEAMGWQVLSVDGHAPAEIHAALAAARKEQGRPTLVRCLTTIGYGAPTLAGTSKTHGSPLGPTEVAGTKEALGMDPDGFFSIPEATVNLLRQHDDARKARRKAWETRLAAHPKRDLWDRLHAETIDLSEVAWPAFENGKSLATRKASQAVLNAVGPVVPSLIGGSADLAGSNGSTLKGEAHISPEDRSGRNVHFGIREHAMAAVCNGLSLHGGVRPYCATFLVFHDYMRPSVRLASLMHQPVIYIYTHDSVYLGEDGPTHQPVEHLSAMRAMPGLWVVRPADAHETAAAWQLALERTDGPVALCLTRQGVPTLAEADGRALEGVRRGGYVLADVDSPDVVLVATGSEVSLALEARAVLAASGTAARVVSLPCWERFLAQDAAYRAAILPAGIPRVSVEAGTTFGWQAIVGLDGATVGIDRFGASAPGKVVASKLGINVDAVVRAAQRLVANT